MSKKIFLMMLISILVPNKIIKIDDRDPNKKNKAFKLYKNNRMSGNFSNLQHLLQDLSELITKRKEDYQ